MTSSLYLKTVSALQTHKITYHKLKVVLSVLYAIFYVSLVLWIKVTASFGCCFCHSFLNFKNFILVFWNTWFINGSWKSWRKVVFDSEHIKKQFLIFDPELLNSIPELVCCFTKLLSHFHIWMKLFVFVYLAFRYFINSRVWHVFLRCYHGTYSFPTLCLVNKDENI